MFVLEIYIDHNLKLTTQQSHFSSVLCLKLIKIMTRAVLGCGRAAP